MSTTFIRYPFDAQFIRRVVEFFITHSHVHMKLNVKKWFKQTEAELTV